MKIWLLCFSLKKINPRNFYSAANKLELEETVVGSVASWENEYGRGCKGKKVRTTSDDAGGKSVSTKSKSVVAKCVSENSTGGWNLLWEDLYGNKLGMLKQECKTRWSSTQNTQNMELSLMKDQENIQSDGIYEMTSAHYPLLCLLLHPCYSTFRAPCFHWVPIGVADLVANGPFLYRYPTHSVSWSLPSPVQHPKIAQTHEMSP